MACQPTAGPSYSGPWDAGLRAEPMFTPPFFFFIFDKQTKWILSGFLGFNDSALLLISNFYCDDMCTTSSFFVLRQENGTSQIQSLDPLNVHPLPAASASSLQLGE